MDSEQFTDLDAIALQLGPEHNVSLSLITFLQDQPKVMWPAPQFAMNGTLMASIVLLEQKIEELRAAADRVRAWPF
jgi:hypothetical protein